MNKKPFGRILFVGIGGGNDIFSTFLAMASLWQIGWRWEKVAIAGILSPFHRHSVEPTSMPGVYITTPESERFLLRKTDPRKIGFVDSDVSKLIQQEKPYRAEIVYGLSISNGSEGLAKSFQELLYKFDYVVLVDIGGDCFYRGDCDKHVLSPMFDAIAIKALIDSKVPGILFEAGPGTDGELEPEVLKKILIKCQPLIYPLSQKIIDNWEQLYEKYIKNIRSGRTVPITIQAFRSPEEKLFLQYRARAHIGSTRFYSFFEQEIDTALCKKFYLVDPTKINNPFAVNCTDPLDWFKKTQVVQQRTNCEVNLEYLQTGEWLLHFLTPSPLFPPKNRYYLIELGLRELCENVCDIALIFRNDWKAIKENWENQFYVFKKDKFVILKLKAR